MEKKKGFITILDTCLVVEYLNNEDQELSIDIFSTTIGFRAPLYLTSFSFYEYFRNVKNSEEIIVKMKKIIETHSGTVHVTGIGDNYTEKFDPEYWLNMDNLDYTEFMEFISMLSEDIKINLSPIIGSVFIAMILTVYLFEAILKDDLEIMNIFIMLQNLLSDNDIRSNLNLMVYESMEVKNEYTEAKKVKELFKSIIKVLEMNTEVEMTKFIPNNLFSNSKPNHVMKIIKKLPKPKIDEYKRVFKLTNPDDFMKSIFDRLFLTNEKQDLMTDGIKYMYVNSDLNGGKISFNDLIDLSNITFIDKFRDQNVIYSTRDKRWRTFIIEQRENHPELETCYIIGDEGQLD